jgi:hypothetical protein
MPSTRARLLADNIPIDAVTTSFFGNGSTLSFTINGSVGLINPNNLIVALDGAVQEPGNDYTVNNNTISFSEPPDNGAKVVVVYRNAPFTTTSIVPTSNTVTTNSIQLNAVTPEKLSLGAPVWDTGFRVALGHSNPAAGLHMNYSNYAAILLGPNATSNSFHITKETNSTLNIWTGLIGSGTNRLCMTSSGDIGIGGITSPQSKVDVYGTIGFGLRSGGGNQPGYLSNIWQGGATGFRFATLGSSYFDGTNWITNHNASFGSNNVSVINVDTSGISLNLNAGTGNTQRTDSSATFNSFERLRINTDGSVNTFNNPINNCPTTVKAYLNFDATIFALAGGAAGPANAPGSTSISQIVAGSSTGVWTWNSNWGRNYIGVIYYFNIGGNNQQYGGVDWTKGIQIISVSGTLATFRILGGPATVTPTFPINGNGTSSGYLYQTFGIRNSFNISAITRAAAGRYRATFKRPMTNDWFISIDGGGNTGAGDGGWSPMDYINNATKNAYSTVNFIDFQSVTHNAGVAGDQQYIYFAVLDHAYNESY